MNINIQSISCNFALLPRKKQPSFPKPLGHLVFMDLPVLCLDTCILLDMLRDPTRNDIRVHEHNSSLVLLLAARSGNVFHVCVAEQVSREFLDNVDRIEEEAKRKVKKLRSQVKKVNDLVSLHGPVSTINLDHWDGHEVRCRAFANLWIQTSTEITQSKVTVDNAFRRVVQVRTPARKGKDSIKDCVILETYLEYVQALRSKRREAPVIFVSSNTQDYASSDRATVKDDAKGEFNSLNLRYAPNMGAARGILGI